VNPTLRTAVGWLAAVLINVGVLVFVAGLVLPRVGGANPVLVTGIVLCILGAALGAVWLVASRATHP
jgi:membrane-bound ClpP family serine protease